MHNSPLSSHLYLRKKKSGNFLARKSDISIFKGQFINSGIISVFCRTTVRGIDLQWAEFCCSPPSVHSLFMLRRHVFP